MARLQVREISNEVQRVSDDHAKTKKLVKGLLVAVALLAVETLVRFL